jgi:hypothetical protein
MKKLLLLAIILGSSLFANNFIYSKDVFSKGEVKIEHYFSGICMDKTNKIIYVTQIQQNSVGNLNYIKSTVCESRFFGPLINKGYKVIYNLLSTKDKIYELHEIDSCN